jgi:hypothetical protein
MRAGVSLRITWFDDSHPDKPGPGEDRQLIKDWVKNNREDLLDIAKFANENEVEAVRIISGDQETNEDGRITLRTLELHFIRGLILILKTMEIQEPGSFESKRLANQLGYLEMPHQEEGARGSDLVTKNK